MKGILDPFELDIQVSELRFNGDLASHITMDCSTEPYDCGCPPN